MTPGTEVNAYDGLIAWRTLRTGREAVIVPLTYGRARLHTRRSAGAFIFDDGW